MFAWPVRCVLLVFLSLPPLAAAQTLQVQLTGDYRPLTASEAAPAVESFEQALALKIGQGLGRQTEFGNDPAAADLQLGEQPGGTVYYRSRVAALTASEGGPADWSALHGQPFCVSVGSPYAAAAAQRFGAVARYYPSAAHALIGLKLGECRAVVEDQRLLAEIAPLPEWRRYQRILPALADVELVMRAEAKLPALQRQVADLLEAMVANGQLHDLTQEWIDEVAFQAYVLADTLDCH